MNKFIHSCFTWLPSTPILDQHILATWVFLLSLQHTLSIPSSGLCAQYSLLQNLFSSICHIRWLSVTGLGNWCVVCLFFNVSDTQMTRERDSQVGLYSASVHEALERLLDKVSFFSTYLPCAFKLIVAICCFHSVVVYHSYTPIRCSCTSFAFSFYVVTISFIEFPSPCNKSSIVDYWIISYHLSCTFFFFYLAEKGARTNWIQILFNGITLFISQPCPSSSQGCIRWREGWDGSVPGNRNS